MDIIEEQTWKYTNICNVCYYESNEKQKILKLTCQVSFYSNTVCFHKHLIAISYSTKLKDPDGPLLKSILCLHNLFKFHLYQTTQSSFYFMWVLPLDAFPWNQHNDKYAYLKISKSHINAYFDNTYVTTTQFLNTKGF